MLFDSTDELQFAEAASRLAFCNPFLPERIECERAALGEAFVVSDAVWSIATDLEGNRPNIGRLQVRVERAD